MKTLNVLAIGGALCLGTVLGQGALGAETARRESLAVTQLQQSAAGSSGVQPTALEEATKAFGQLKVSVVSAIFLQEVSAFAGARTGRGGAAPVGKVWLQIDAQAESNKHEGSLPSWPLSEVAVLGADGTKYAAVAVTAVGNSSYCFIQDASERCSLDAAFANDKSFIGSAFTKDGESFLVLPSTVGGDSGHGPNFSSSGRARARAVEHHVRQSEQQG